MVSLGSMVLICIHGVSMSHILSISLCISEIELLKLKIIQ